MSRKPAELLVVKHHLSYFEKLSRLEQKLKSWHWQCTNQRYQQTLNCFPKQNLLRSSLHREGLPHHNTARQMHPSRKMLNSRTVISKVRHLILIELSPCFVLNIGFKVKPFSTNMLICETFLKNINVVLRKRSFLNICDLQKHKITAVSLFNFQLAVYFVIIFTAFLGRFSIISDSE